MRDVSDMLGDLKISIENRIKELEEMQDIYKIDIYSDGTGWNKHLEIYYRGKAFMCIPACIIKKRLTQRYIKALMYCLYNPNGLNFKFYLYPENRKASPGKFSDIEYLTGTYYCGKDYNS